MNGELFDSSDAFCLIPCEGRDGERELADRLAREQAERELERRQRKLDLGKDSTDSLTEKYGLTSILYANLWELERAMTPDELKVARAMRMAHTAQIKSP